MRLTNKKYGLDVDPQNLPPELFYNCEKTFGHFIEDGRGYVVTDKNPPRPWFQYLCNDNFFSAVTNKGLGFTCFHQNLRVTKYYEEMNYLPRLPNAGRKILIRDQKSGRTVDFFEDCENLLFTVRPGYVEYSGNVGELRIHMTLFVPDQDNCECWKVSFCNESQAKKEYEFSFMQDWAFSYLGNDTIIGFEHHEKDIVAIVADKDLFDSLFGLFSANIPVTSYVAQYQETVWGRPETFSKVTMSASVSLACGESKTVLITSGVATDRKDIDRMKDLYASEKNYDASMEAVVSKWDTYITKNECRVPDPVFQNFVNIWLKNQLALTYRYCRMYNIGYRDVMQDTWAFSLVDPSESRRMLLQALSYMYEDGRCARTYNTIEGHMMKDDFCDSPVWIPNSLTAYIKETGDFAILDEMLPYLGSDRTGTVKEHVLTAIGLLWKERGRNGLVKMREGDWLDGLSGIQKFGDDATSVWCTIAAFWAQNTLAELFDEVRDTETATMLRERSAAYKKAFDEVAWDGKWCTYAFFEDGEPIGSSKNYEGKIYLNAQTWAIFTGILDDEKKINQVEKSVQRYLMTPFGCQLMEPPYVYYGDRCGRIHRQIPGTFANGAIYNHAASMKIFSDVKRGDGESAVDTFLRCCPNHMDNPDLRRTSEPWCVGNVYYGPDHDHYGMNLFSWFTGTPGWLLQGGYSQILGVQADYHGLKIQPCVPDDWAEFSVKKTYRNCVYQIRFQRSEEKGIWADGVKIEGNTVYSDRETCEVLVKF